MRPGNHVTGSGRRCAMRHEDGAGDGDRFTLHSRGAVEDAEGVSTGTGGPATFERPNPDDGSGPAGNLVRLDVVQSFGLADAHTANQSCRGSELEHVSRRV